MRARRVRSEEPLPGSTCAGAVTLRGERLHAQDLGLLGERARGEAPIVRIEESDRALDLAGLESGALTTVGDFDCVGKTGPAKTMTDLAVAKDGKLYGVSEGAPRSHVSGSSAG